MFEDHREAYFFWKKLGFFDVCCVHVDAHLDISNFPLPGFTFDPLGAPWLNCGNYLYHAIVEGIVSRVVWVAPPWLMGPPEGRLEWARAELQNWVRLTVAEHESLRRVGARVEGMLCGVPFAVCDTDSLPELGGQPIALDVDVDYFVATEDRIWQSPQDLAGALSIYHPWDALTVALSVHGGYTPAHLRYLGELTKLTLTLPEKAERVSQEPWWLASRVVEGNPEPGDPRWDEAARIDPNHVSHEVDRAAYHFQRRQLDECLAALDRLSGQRELAVAADYIRSFVAYFRGDDQAALNGWTALLSQATEPLARAHLLQMAGRAALRGGQDARARDVLEESLTLSPGDAQLWRDCARAWENLGERERAVERYRRSIQLAPDELATQPCRYQLARLYQRSGKSTQAVAELERLLAECPKGSLTARAQLLLARLRIR